MLNKLKYRLKQRLPRGHWLFRLHHCLRHPYQRRDYLLYAFPPESAAAPALPSATEAMLEQLAATQKMSPREYRFALHCRECHQSEMPVILDERQEPAGWTLLSTFPHRSAYCGIVASPRRESCYIHNTKVLPYARGRGFGMELNREALRRAGRRCAYCLVRADNPAAIRNWEKCGHTPIGSIRCRRWFLFRWRHRLIAAAPYWRRTALSGRRADLELHAAPAEWESEHLRIRCRR